MLARLTTLLHRAAIRFTLPCLVVLTTAGGVLAAPVAQAHGNKPVMHVVNIEAHDNGKDNAAFRGSFEMPRKVPTGLVEFQFENDGVQSHMAQFFRLKDGVSEKTFLTRLTALFSSQNPKVVVPALKALLAISAAAGGAGSIESGKQQDVIERLRSGHYVAVCFDSTSNGTPHFLLGMFRGFWVSDDAHARVDRDERLDDGVPVSDGRVLEFDHQINVPHDITEHEPLLLKVTVRDQTHEFGLIRIPDGTTKADLLACFMGSPSCKLHAPPIDSGGTAAIAPGGTQWVELHLAPGTYAALCFVPDIMTGMPHAFMGMITVFKVSHDHGHTHSASTETN